MVSVAEPIVKQNWEEFFRRYGQDRNETLGDVAKWVSKRPSLNIACELLSVDKCHVQSLAEWLDRHGYKVPPISTKDDYHFGGNADAGKPRTDAKETFTVLDDIDRTFTLKEMTMFDRMWRRGLSIDAMADVLNRDSAEVFCLIVHKWRQKKLEDNRKSRIWGKPSL